MYPFLKSWMETKKNANMSHLPDVSDISTPPRSHDHAHPNDVSRKSDPGPGYSAGASVASGHMSPSNRNMKDFGTQISELKKENFSLKLRIFYMEERMMEQFSGDHDQLWRTNIELKVECDSLRKELSEKHDLLIKASNAVACMDAGDPEEVRKVRQEAEREIAELRELMNEKLETAERELQAAHQDSEQALEQALKMKKELLDLRQENQELNDALNTAKEDLKKGNLLLTRDRNSTDPDSFDLPNHKPSLQQEEKIVGLERRIDELNDELREKDKTIVQLQNSLATKQTVIELLSEEKQSIADEKIQPLFTENSELHLKLQEALEEAKQQQIAFDNLKQKEQDAHKRYQDVLLLQDEYQEHITEQQQRLDDFELATKQMSEELEKREIEVKDLKDALKETEDTAAELTSKLEAHSSEDKHQHEKLLKDLKKRDRAIAGLTQVAHKKADEITALKDEIRLKEERIEELTEQLQNLEVGKSKKQNSPSKNDLLQQLRQQLKESDSAMQDALDDRVQRENEHEKALRELNHQIREQHRQIERLKGQISEYEETVASMDADIREKDWQLQELATKHKNLLRDLQLKEEERLRALRERDELLAECEEEKAKFSGLANRMRHRSGSDFGSNSSLCDSDSSTNRMKRLEDELLKKNQALKDANVARERALAEQVASRQELEDALSARKLEEEKNRRSSSLKDVEIRQLKDLLRNKDESLHDVENQLRFEINKLSRQNIDMLETIKSQEEHIENMKKKQVSQQISSTANTTKRSTHGTETESNQRENREFYSNEISHLKQQLVAKNKEIEQLQKASSIKFDSDASDGKSSPCVGSNITYNYYYGSQRQPKLKEKRNHDRSTSALHFSQSNLNGSDEESTTSDGFSGTPTYNRLRQVHAENRAGSRTMDTTFGIPLDQTSYLSMPDGYHSDSDVPGEGGDYQHLTLSKLKKALQATRKQLSEAINEVADLKKTCQDYSNNVHELEALVGEKLEENQRLVEQCREAKEEKMAKESEVMGLLARIRDNNKKSPSKKKRAGLKGFKDECPSDSDSAMSSARERRRSGDESDGMSSLSRKELRDIIINLKKKLHNAEKVNELLKEQLHNKTTEEERNKSKVDHQLVVELTEEIARLKSHLKTQPEKKDHPTSALKSTGLSSFPSRLPVPRNYKGGNTPAENPLRPELDRARALNRKLNERLAATEQTVRQQAEKLRKCRAALREAGIASPPVSPIRAFRSVPNLFLPHDVDAEREIVVERKRSISTDTNDASTQTHSIDSGISLSVSPKSEQRFNSLIQAQAKELSSLRQQFKKARENCKNLQMEMDVVSRYLHALLSSPHGDSLDSSLAEGLHEELERSKKLVAKLRRSLSDKMVDVCHSDDDSDSSHVASPSPTATIEDQQLESLKNELNEKNNLISDLRGTITILEGNRMLFEHRLQAEPRIAAEKWLSSPNLPFSSHHSPARTSSNAFKKRPSSVGTPYQGRDEQGLLTPVSSHLSLHTASEDEVKRIYEDTSRLPTRLGDNDDRYASLPSVLDNDHTQHRASWPIGRSQAPPQSRKSMPMYQRTIAVTEYLPPSIKHGKDAASYLPYSSGADDVLAKSPHHFLPTTADDAHCIASYGGNWVPSTLTPRKSNENLQHTTRSRLNPFMESTRMDFEESSCDGATADRNHKLSREVDRLRRRLSDSKRINRSLKEELDVANKSLRTTRESMVPGYHRSAIHDSGVLAEHLSEIRELRQRLEHTIATNDKLREKLEARLRDENDRECLSANIYVGHDEDTKMSFTSQLQDLKQKLKKVEAENEKLRKRLKAEEKAHSTYQDAIEEMKTMQNAMVEKSNKIDQLTGHVQLLQGELKKQTTLSNRLGRELMVCNEDLAEYKLKLDRLENEKKQVLTEREMERDRSSCLASDVENSKIQLNECRQLIDSLKSELALYEKLHKNNKKTKASQISSAPPLDLSELLQEIRSLRIQLERSIDANAALRKQLEEQLRSQPKHEEGGVTTINIHHVSPRDAQKDRSASRRSPHSARRKLKLETCGDVDGEDVMMTPPASASSGGEEHSFYFDPLSSTHAGKSSHRDRDKLAVSSPVDGSDIQNGQEEPDNKPLYSRGGPYTICKTNDFHKLQQSIAKSGLIARATDGKIADTFRIYFRQTSSEKKVFKNVWKSISSLCQHLDDSDQILRLFWPVVIPYTPESLTLTDGRTRSCSSSGVATGGHYSSAESPIPAHRQGSDATGDFSVTSETDGLRREVGKLRRRLTTQDRLLQTTVERLQNTNRLKEGIEHAIVKQLSKTHDVLRKARGNLEAKVHDGETRPYHVS